MRTLCFGGTFNPIHHGHLICARAAAEAAAFEQVLLIPSARPPLRANEPDMTAPSDRMTMCQLAVHNDPFFRVSDVELRRTERSFTIDTARGFKQDGWTEVHWLIGADAVPHLPRWHDAPRLLEEVHFVVMARPNCDYDWNSLPQAFQSLRQNVVPAPLVEISATEIRRRVLAGRPIDFLTPPSVVQYIEERGLYRA